MTRLNTIMTTTALAAASIVATGNAAAQTDTAGTQRGVAAASAVGMAAAPSSADHTFVVEAAKGGMAEVALGQLAQQTGGSDAVKQFGARMVEDHTKANDELKQLASSKRIMLPTAPPRNAKMQKLESMSGTAFDRAYTAEMLADHKKTIGLFEKESSSGRDADIKAFATKTLPTLKGHLEMLQAGLLAGPADAVQRKR